MKFYTPKIIMIRLLIAVFLCIGVFSCAKNQHSFASLYNFTGRKPFPDYSSLDYWAAHPWKKDPSDSLSKPLKKELRDSIADVFFIHPTTYTETKKEWNADINDAALAAKTDYTSILYQASVFNQHCRVFAPRYRQAHLSAFFVNNNETKAAFDTAYADLKTAFEFYLMHYNHNRPIIIAGHSQGALMCIRLLKEFFDGKPLQQKLIAAYIVGWPVPQNSFDALPVCTEPLQTGCFCSWRTLKKNYIPEYMKNETIVSYVTNPLSWDTTSAYVSRDHNKGSILRSYNDIVLHTTDAQVHNGVLWANKPKFPGSVFFRTRNYHIGDMNLYYMNLRENIEQRIFSYFKKN
jgi:hypothetical protein